MRFGISVLAVPVAGLMMSACCNLIGCQNSVGIELVDLPEDPGMYEVTATGDGDASCQFEIDEDGSAVFDTAADSCFRTADLYFVRFGLGEGEYRVALSDDDGELASTTISPDSFRFFSPNGKRCGPTCASAHVTLEL